jgi:signal transduction histidine kinase
MQDQDMEKAEILFLKAKEALENCKECGQLQAQELLIDESELLKAQGKLREAIKLLEKSNAIIDSERELGAKVANLEKLSELYAAVQDYSKAYNILLETYSLQGKLLKSAHTNELNAFRVRFEVEKKEAIIKAQEMELAAQKNWLFFLIVSITAAALLTATLLYILYQRKKASKLLALHNRQLQIANAELNSALAQIQKQKEELAASLATIEKQQETLIQTQKIAAIAELSANIAHELNTPLSVIQSATQALQRRHDPDYQALSSLYPSLTAAQIQFIEGWFTRAIITHAPQKERELTRACAKELNVEIIWARKLAALNINNKQAIESANLDIHSPSFFTVIELAYNIANENAALQNINTATQRTQKIIQLINWFAENKKAPESYTDIEPAIEKTLISYNHYFHLDKIKLICKYELALGTYVKGSQSDIVYIITQLIQNAIYAMQGKGILSIETRNIDSSLVQITVKDNGPGIPQELQEKIFQPFITDKKSGEGAGLGLYVTKKIITTLGGAIKFESEPGNTCFIITLPTIRSTNNGQNLPTPIIRSA